MGTRQPGQEEGHGIGATTSLVLARQGAKVVSVSNAPGPWQAGHPPPERAVPCPPPPGSPRRRGWSYAPRRAGPRTGPAPARSSRRPPLEAPRRGAPRGAVPPVRPRPPSTSTPSTPVDRTGRGLSPRSRRITSRRRRRKKGRSRGGGDLPVPLRDGVLGVAQGTAQRRQRPPVQPGRLERDCVGAGGAAAVDETVGRTRKEKQGGQIRPVGGGGGGIRGPDRWR